MFYQRRSIFRKSGLGPTVKAANLFADVANIDSCVGLWYFDVNGYTSAANKIFANQCAAGGNDMVEISGASNLDLDQTNAPPGGIWQVGSMNADTSLTLGNIMPTGPSQQWTKVICFKPSMLNYPGGNDGLNHELWRCNSGNTDIHALRVASSSVTGRIGSTGSFLDVTARVALGAWNYAIHEWQQSSKQSNLAVNNGTIADSATGTTQVSGNASAFIGGDDSSGSFIGSIALVALFRGDSGSNGLLLNSSQANNLKKVTDLCDAVIGRLRLY